MSSDIYVAERRITIRLPEQLHAQIRQAAIKEANSPSAIARRLIAQGLARERKREARAEAEASR